MRELKSEGNVYVTELKINKSLYTCDATTRRKRDMFRISTTCKSSKPNKWFQINLTEF